jgi:serine/threonine protein kinase
VTPSGSAESLIARLLELPASERTAFLEQACSDNNVLRAHLAEIARTLAVAGHVLQPELHPRTPPAAIVGMLESALEAAEDESVGTRIGPYKLLHEIGSGGFGIVWMAEQVEPVQRRVALKVIKHGMDTHEVIARFEAERQALAMMDHPNIARVFDAGATDSGRPYFVMELGAASRSRGSATRIICPPRSASNCLSPFARLCSTHIKKV